MGNMERLEAIALALPESIRVDIEEVDGEPTFRGSHEEFRVHGSGRQWDQREATQG